MLSWGLAVCLCAGAVTTIVVAWWIALAAKQPVSFAHQYAVNRATDEKPVYIDLFRFTDQYRTGFRFIELSSVSTPFDAAIAERVRAEVAKGDPLPAEQREQALTYFYLYPCRSPEWPGWLPRVPEGGAYTRWSARASGWPFLCMSSRRMTTVGGVATVTGSLRVFHRARYRAVFNGDPELGCLPLLPSWPGFAADTFFYGLPWLLVVSGLPLWRRWWRANRGLCLHCGYNRRGLGDAEPCPECGSASGRPPTPLPPAPC